jgi:sensor histidine kinase YesM
MMTSQAQIWLTFQAFFQGVLLFQALYMGFHFVALKRREYLYYASYVSIKSVYFIIQSIEIYRNPDTFSVQTSDTFHYFKFLAVGAYLMYYLFISDFFDYEKNLPKIAMWGRRVEKVLMGYIALNFLLLLLNIPQKVQNMVYSAFVLPLFIVSIILLVQAMKTLRDRKAYFIIIGTVAFATGSVVSLILVSILKIQTFEWFRLAGILIELVCFSIALAIKNQEIEEEKQRIQSKLAEAEIAALRSQMNPHFIFNSLSSINNFMLDNNSEQASFYLTKFARLIRLVLENSRTEKVLLANELYALELYLEMEGLRFKEKLKYVIQIDPSVSPDFLEIPPLLLQPYVENAIWHGLMHKKQGGTVTIAINQLEENLLHISISDDGIGRERAEELKSRSAMRQKSFGMQITSERLNAINTIFKTQTCITVEDLTDTEGAACGTKVNLTIPC